MATTFMINEEITRGMVCFFHQKALLLNFVMQKSKCSDFYYKKKYFKFNHDI
jgi:hypothetical protein